ncbi:MAG: type IV pilus secretin PilQ [Polaromonas sp.]|jgi:type IV pilus assembly protein PilQ|uniref:type IV pilus secretin PilQ n=1 Tax=Comamonadaceae TaxID=80864 RepID=UPI0027314965|nr:MULTISPECIES: type IV pilus secretin PilQ [Comamonadaceae]MDP1684418.1 type IV pilus secretin PilQ [Hydrogenophaga sp.]MDP3249719.1 type IV pilus secretin PilQ [Polaromonas sp.]
MNKPNKASVVSAVHWAAVKGAVVACMAFTTVWAQAQNAIQSLTGGVQGGVEVIRINTAQPLTAVPTGFTIQAPARIALDFPGVANAIGRSTVEINEGNLRSANVIQAGDRTRVVINLKQAASYETKIEGNSLLVVLQRSEVVTAASAPPAAFAESRNRDVSSLRDIDFRRGVGNAGRVVVELANNQVGVDIRQQGQNLVVEFLKTSLPEGLRRRLDVSDFGTPVQSVTTSQTGDRVRMVVAPKGNWEHSAYQSDNQFVLEIREQKIDSSKLTQGPGYNGEKLSLNFQNIEVRSLLQVIADFTNFNIVTSDSVTGSVTLRLKDVPWDQALDIILQAKGLGMRKSGNVLWIAPKDEIAAREKQDLEARASTESLEALRTQGFQMNYAKAVDIATQLTSSGSGSSSGGGNSARILSERGSVISEPRTNQLFVTDIPSKLQAVQDLIAKLDIPIRQVIIEARIVEADDSFGKSLGVRLGGGVRGFGVGSANGNPVQGNFGSTYGAVSTGPTTTSQPFVSLPANPSNALAASYALSLFSPNASRFLSLEISALESDGKGRIVSSPRVVTADQVKALIEQGTEFPYQTATSSGATAIAFRKANLKLEVTPQITPEGNIILDLDINKDSRGESTPDGIAINTKHVQTQVLVENGGTVVIGGIFEQTERDQVNKVPLLGDLPGLGNLFKSRERINNKSELLIFITPRVLGRSAIN